MMAHRRRRAAAGLRPVSVAACLTCSLLLALALTGCTLAQDTASRLASSVTAATPGPTAQPPRGSPSPRQAAAVNTPAPTSAPPPEAAPTPEGWRTYRRSYGEWGFELRHPSDWAENNTTVECAEVHELGPVKLLVFDACWEKEVGGGRLTFDATYRRFRDAFVDGVSDTVTTRQDVQVEVAHFRRAPESNGIYTSTASTGSVALWWREQKGFALLDAGDQAQAKGIFDEILQSFRYLDWNPTQGGRIAFTRQVQNSTASLDTHPVCHIFVVDSKGGEPVDLTPDGEGCDLDPAYSPDGRQIAFIRDNSLFVMKADGSDPGRVSTAAYFMTYGPIYWSTNGAKVALYYSGDFRFHTYTLDGKNLEKVAKLPPEEWRLPDYSPDRSQRADYCAPDPDVPSIADVCLYPVGEGKEINLTKAPVELNRRLLSWSPDGKRIAFSSRDKVYLIHADGTGLTKLADGTSPSWQPAPPLPATATPTPTPSATPTPGKKV